VEAEELQFAPRADGPVGLGGWLVLPIIGLFLTTALVGFSAFSQVLPVFFSSTWSNLTTPGSAAFHPSWATFLVASAISHFVVLFGAAAALVLMFRKSRFLPLTIMLFYVAVVIYAYIDYWAVFGFLTEAAPGAAAEAKPESIKTLGRSIVACLIWIPYFATSKRVKNTFVN
jgi:hypothetical protein